MSVEVVRHSLTTLQALQGDPADVLKLWSPDFRLVSNGTQYDRREFANMWKERQALLNRPEARFVDIYARNGMVAAWRQASISTKQGTQAPAVVVIDVWHVEDGKVASGEQCWQVVRSSPCDELAATQQEGARAEAVRTALEGMGDLAHAQDSLSRHYAPDFAGCMDGVLMDLPALRRHWEALQGALQSLRVAVHEVVVHGSAVGAAYHLLATKRGGGVAELRVLAVMRVVDHRIASCQAVSRLIQGAPEDERLLSALSEQ